MNKKKKIAIILITVLIFISLGLIFIFSILNKVDKVDNWDTKKYKENENLKETETTVDYSNYLNKIKDTTNILLLGEENIEELKENKRGRTDSMMILTINKNNKSIKLTSLMRDTFVQIPGYKNNKLNSAYQLGGVPLIKETVELNYGISIDTTVLVGFSDLEKIIDILGGININISQEEADYLNNSNYIEGNFESLKKGMNHFSGNMALGYCRIRYVGTESNEYNDFGRTSRQRTVLNAIFESYKNKSIPEMVSLLNKLLPYIKTDLTNSEIINYIAEFVNMMPLSLELFRLPIDNKYSDKKIDYCGEVLDLNWKENLIAFHKFLEDDVSSNEIEQYLNNINKIETTKEVKNPNNTNNNNTNNNINVPIKESNKIKETTSYIETTINNSIDETTTVLESETTIETTSETSNNNTESTKN